MHQVLLVEDDPLIAKTLKTSLSDEGYQMEVCCCLKDAGEVLGKRSFDILLIDLQMPEGESFPLLEEIRRAGNSVPIIYLTARRDEESVIKALRLGADDFLHKPFRIGELIARMDRLLRRSRAPSDVLIAGSVRLELKAGQVFASDVNLQLTHREFQILALLVARKGEMVARAHILDSIDKDAELTERTLDSHISRIRAKLKKGGATDIRIVGVYGAGYRLELA